MAIKTIKLKRTNLDVDNKKVADAVLQNGEPLLATDYLITGNGNDAIKDLKVFKKYKKIFADTIVFFKDKGNGIFRLITENSVDPENDAILIDASTVVSGDKKSILTIVKENEQEGNKTVRVKLPIGNWVGPDDGLKIQIITVDENGTPLTYTEDQTPVIAPYLPEFSTKDEVDDYYEAYNCIDKIETIAGGLKAYCFGDKPEQEIRLSVKGH